MLLSRARAKLLLGVRADLREDGDAGARDAARRGRGGGITAHVHGDPVLAGELLLGRRHIELGVVEPDCVDLALSCTSLSSLFLVFVYDIIMLLFDVVVFIWAVELVQAVLGDLEQRLGGSVGGHEVLALSFRYVDLCAMYGMVVAMMLLYVCSI